MTDRPTAEEMAGWRALCDAAGPPVSLKWVFPEHGSNLNHAERRFIEKSREMVGALLDEVARLTEERDEDQAQIERWAVEADATIVRLTAERDAARAEVARLTEEAAQADALFEAGMDALVDAAGKVRAERDAARAEQESTVGRATVADVDPWHPGGDGTHRLCVTLYGPHGDTARNWLGGSEAKMLHDAADEIVHLRALLGRCRRFVDGARVRKVGDEWPALGLLMPGLLDDLTAALGEDDA